MDVVEAVALFFLNPLFVVALLAAVALGYFRVKRERRGFQGPAVARIDGVEAVVGGVMVLCDADIGSDCGGRIGCRSGVARSVFATVAYRFVFHFIYKAASPIYFAAVLSFCILFHQNDCWRFRSLGLEFGTSRSVR